MTGHDFKSVSAIYEYLDADRALALVGALVAAGWPALPWGQTGAGPVPPSLEALQTLAAPYQKIRMELLENVIDALFHIDSASPPMLASPRSHPVLGCYGALPRCSCTTRSAWRQARCRLSTCNSRLC